jgi:hypothetical protein
MGARRLHQARRRRRAGQPAPVDQPFIVVAGAGWASGADGERVPLATGTAIHWEAGEEHESGSDQGLSAIVVESERLIPHLRDV